VALNKILVLLFLANVNAKEKSPETVDIVRPDK